MVQWRERLQILLFMVNFEQWLNIISTNRKGGKGILPWQKEKLGCVQGTSLNVGDFPGFQWLRL